MAATYSAISIATDTGSEVQSKINTGSSGTVFTSNGTGSAPSWQAPAASSISITGDTGGALTGAAFTFNAKSQAGSSVSFSGSGSAISLNTTDGNSNTIIGSSAGNGSISGTGNSALGNNCLFSLTSGVGNTCSGRYSGYYITSGTYNSFFGYDTALASVFTGSYNIGIGYTSGNGYAGAESSNILLNSIGVTSESNALHIGSGTGTGTQQLNSAFICGITGITVTGTAVLVSTGNQLGVAVSSRKYKENIVDMGDYSSDILKLRPVTFTLKGHEDQTIQSGLIAEEVHDIFPDIMVYDKNGDPQTVQYHNLPALLLNELQKALKRIEALEAKI